MSLTVSSRNPSSATSDTNPPTRLIPGPRQPVPCACADCHVLNAFLVHITQQSARFAGAKKRREHVAQKVRTYCPDAMCEILRHGSPQTLAATKGNRAAVEYGDWLARCREARAEMVKFDEKLLRELLGEDFTRVFVRWVLFVSDPAHGPVFGARQPLQAVENLPAASSGVKRKGDAAEGGEASSTRRKTEVIDLDDSAYAARWGRR